MKVIAIWKTKKDDRFKSLFHADDSPVIFLSEHDARTRATHFLTARPSSDQPEIHVFGVDPSGPDFKRHLAAFIQVWDIEIVRSARHNS